MHDVDFLALLVHRKHLRREDAETLLPALKTGRALDELLEERIGWSAERIAKLRNSRAGELPQIPGYEVLECVGTGGTADVFLARDKKTRRPFALKVLKSEVTAHEPTRKSFIAEARLLEKLEHPGLVRGHGIARSGNIFFSRMQFVEGKTILERLDGDQPFPEDQALRIVLETAAVLRYLEEKGVVHRDVKPGNLMLDAGGKVVLIDLGFAAPEATSSPEDSTVGTVQYLSPEQCRGGAAADSRSDIYSLGISLFHMVCGRLPFESSDDREVLRMQVMESLSSKELKGRNLSPHLQYFVEKMVAKEADHRYQSWSELIEDIQGQLDGWADLDFENSAPGRRGR